MECRLGPFGLHVPASDVFHRGGTAQEDPDVAMLGKAMVSLAGTDAVRALACRKERLSHSGLGLPSRKSRVLRSQRDSSNQKEVK